MVTDECFPCVQSNASLHLQETLKPQALDDILRSELTASSAHFNCSNTVTADDHNSMRSISDYLLLYEVPVRVSYASARELRRLVTRRRLLSERHPDSRSPCTPLSPPWSSPQLPCFLEALAADHAAHPSHVDCASRRFRAP